MSYYKHEHFHFPSSRALKFVGILCIYLAAEWYLIICGFSVVLFFFFFLTLNSSRSFKLLNRYGDTMAFHAPCHCNDPSDNFVSCTSSVPSVQSLNQVLTATLSAMFGGILQLWSHVKSDI